MTSAIETIGGHLYLVQRDDDGNITAQQARDPISLPSPPLTKYEFRRLFTVAERVAIDNYATSALPDLQKAQVRTMQFDFSIADNISLADSELIAGVRSLEAFGLIATGRAAQILANTPPSS